MDPNRKAANRHLHYDLKAGALEIDVTRAGDDAVILVRGGERPHIGCVVLAVPRRSLRGDGSASCTSSCLNLTGHKDEEICRILAERACRAWQCVTVCTGGFHKDHISAEEIEELMACVRSVDFNVML